MAAIGSLAIHAAPHAATRRTVKEVLSPTELNISFHLRVPEYRLLFVAKCLDTRSLVGKIYVEFIYRNIILPIACIDFKACVSL